jgi:acetylornithine deacetylase/succinyl-diaminopimelate desuccinylase-like protein
MDRTILTRILDLAITLQQIPAPTLAETERAVYLHERFRVEGLCDVERDGLDNVYGRLPGMGSSPPLVISAHSDTVFQMDTDLRLIRDDDRIAAPGIGDNSLGLAGLMGLVWALRERGIQLPGDLWLVANVGEEGLGNLRGMRAVVDRFEDGPLAYIVLEGMALGQVYHRGLGVQRYRITANTAGGHSWVDHGVPSAIHELAVLITQLDALRLSHQPRSTLNVGVIAGGTSVNTIASKAHLELDLRSEAAENLNELLGQVEALIEKRERADVHFELEKIGHRPLGELPSNHPLVRLAVRALKREGVDAKLNIGSTDANVPLSRGIPAICIGLTTGGKAHTMDEYIYTQPLAQGLEQLIRVVRGAFRSLS